MHKPVKELVIADFQGLIDNAVCESRHLDYKRQIDIQTSGQKKEFLYDISAMANSGGGELIYGIDEERLDDKPTGKPIQITGIQVATPDNMRLTIENLLRDSLNPRITGHAIEFIELDGNKDTYIMIIRIPHSLNSPHMVTFEKAYKLYTRNSSGKHQMDISEIRTAILAGKTFIEEVLEWRIEQIAKILANEGCVNIKDGPKIVFHLIPLYFSNPMNFIDAKLLMAQSDHLSALYAGEIDSRFNLHGFITSQKFSSDIWPFTYTQFFRTGQIEFVEADILNHYRHIPRTFEKNIIERTKKYLQAMQNVDIQPPIVLGLSLLNVKKYPMWKDGSRDDIFIKSKAIEDDDLVLPVGILEDWTQDVSAALKPVFDNLWNACGYPGSINFDQEGNWISDK